MNEIETVEVSLKSILGVVVAPAVLGVVVWKLAEDVRNDVALNGVDLGCVELATTSVVALTFEIRTE